jgi:hypothetical protein
MQPSFERRATLAVARAGRDATDALPKKNFVGVRMLTRVCAGPR